MMIGVNPGASVQVGAAGLGGKALGWAWTDPHTGSVTFQDFIFFLRCRSLLGEPEG